MVTTLLNFLILPAEEDSPNILSQLETIAICISIFILIYLIVNGMAIIFKWLFDALFNKRLIPAEKKKGYLIFHKKIVNHIYLGVSFENKYNMYLSKAEKNNDELDFDLATNYLSQSVYYFKIAKEELQRLIPEKNSGRREKRNAKFMEFIGFPLINISLISGQRSLNRLLSAEKTITTFVNKITVQSNGGVIKQAYTTSISNLYSDIERLTGRYEDFLERSITLQTLAEKEQQ